MKLTIFLTLFSFLQIIASSYSQSITIKMENVKLEKVIKEIESRTDYKFLYNRKDVDLKSTVSVNAVDEEVQFVLSKLFINTDIGFEILNKQIILKKRAVDDPTSGAVGPGKEDAQIENVQFQVSGTVVDNNDVPLPGANIVEVGTTNGVTADFDGNFTILVADENAALSVSYIGFITQEVPINGRSNLTITMAEDQARLDEVVVVGFGTQKKVNLTGAVSTLDSEFIENRPITNATQALQGIQGVYINQVGGQPGNDNATIRIRGVGTLNDNDPLVLVDGIEFSIDDINPSDIESITVLKDAASAAIYGSRAANGVVLVTTKKGGGESLISFDSSVGVQEVISLPNVIHDPIQWFELYSQAQRNVGTSEGALRFSDEFIEDYRQGMQTNPLAYPSNNWQEIMFDQAFIQQHNLRFADGFGKSNYALSIGYLEQDGVMRGTNSERYNVNFNINSEIKPFLNIGGTVNFSYRETEEPVPGISSTMSFILRATPGHPTRLANGNYAMNFYDIPGHRRWRNPLALTDEGENDINNLKLFLNTYAEVKLPFDIKYKFNFAVTSENERRRRFIPELVLFDALTEEPTQIQAGGGSILSFPQGPRGVDQRDDEELNYTIFNTLSWNKDLGKNTNLSLLLGQSYERFRTTFFTAGNEGFLSNDLFELNAGSTNPTVSGNTLESALISYFGRANLVLRDKYLFEANFRYDGSSRFADGNQFGFFPSVSAGWRLNEENFLKDVDWLGQLKLRASWGELGNERIGNYRFLDLVAPSQDFIFGNSINPGSAVLVDNDESITWETTTITNIGLDASFFGGKLATSFEYFDKTTEDVLRPVAIPDQVGGLGGPVQNVGTIQNTGFEVSLSHRNVINDFSYEISGNLTYLQNEVVDLNGEVIIDNFSTIDPRRAPLNITQEGGPINQFLLFQSDGLFQSQEEIDAHAFQGNDTRPGYIRYKDLNDDGVIDLEDRIPDGNTIPDLTYTFNINFAYKNWSLNTFWQGVEGVSTFNKHTSGVPFWFGGALPVDWATDTWTPDNRDASLPLLTRFQDTQNTLFRDSDFFLLDASYLRLKNVQLTYNFGPEVLDPLKIKKLAIFCNAQNLLTFTTLDDFDPETELLGGNFFNYPSTRIYTIGLNLSF